MWVLTTRRSVLVQTPFLLLRVMTMEERREHPRSTALTKVIPCQIRLPSGKILKGSVQDLSERGAKITGDTAGLSVGAEITLTFLLPLDTKVGYRCRVKYVDPEGKSWGARFTSKVLLAPSM